MKMIYSEEAIRDLVRLKKLIEAKNPLAAQNASKSIRKGVFQLKEFPKLGVKVDSAPDPEVVRDLAIGRYLARYLITEKVVYILRVWHHKEDNRK